MHNESTDPVYSSGVKIVALIHGSSILSINVGSGKSAGLCNAFWIPFWRLTLYTTDGAVVENTVVYATYAMDAFTVGIQSNSTDSQTANSDTDFEAWGVSYAVSEDLSISYGASTVEYESGASKSDQEADAVGISWTNGSMSVVASRHSIDNVAGAPADDRDVTEVNLTFAF